MLLGDPEHFPNNVSKNANIWQIFLKFSVGVVVVWWARVFTYVQYVWTRACLQLPYVHVCGCAHVCGCVHVCALCLDAHEHLRVHVRFKHMLG